MQATELAELLRGHNGYLDFVSRYDSMQRLVEKLAAERGKPRLTVINYAGAVLKFSEFVKLTPDEIVKLPTAEIKQKVQDFLGYMRKNFAESTAITRTQAVKSFLEANSTDERNLVPRVRLIKQNKDWTSPVYALTFDEIHAMLLANPNIKLKLAIHLCAQCGGLRPEALLGITYGDIIDAETFRPLTMDQVRKADPNKYYLIHVRGEIAKGGSGYYSTLHPETLAVIKESLEKRKNVTSKSKIVGYSAYPMLWKAFRRLLWRAGLRDSPRSGKKSDTLTIKSLRKFFKVQASPINENLCEYFMGHRTGLNKAYYEFMSAGRFVLMVKADLDRMVEALSLKTEAAKASRTIEQLRGEYEARITGLEEKLAITNRMGTLTFEVLKEANPKVFQRLVDTKGMGKEFDHIRKRLRE